MGFWDWLDTHPGWGFVYLTVIMLCLLGMVSAIAARGKPPSRSLPPKGPDGPEEE